MVVAGDGAKFFKMGFSSAQRTSIGGPLNSEVEYGNRILDLGHTNGDMGTKNCDGNVLNLDSAEKLREYQNTRKLLAKILMISLSRRPF